MSIVALCHEAARRRPEAPLFSFLTDGETQAVSLTRGELHQQACTVAAELVARGLTGRRVLLLYVPGLDFIVSFVACLYAGAIAVPAYPPDPARLPRTLPRLAAIVADCDPALVLTTTPLLEMAPFVFSLAPELARVAWAASDTWTQPAQRDLAAPLAGPARPDDLAFIQYTSGSTATPKGVMIGHDNLLANLRQLQHARRGGEHTTIVSWLPFYHDLGLIGAILFPLFLGGRSILMSPIDFLKRPVRWLRAIDRYRADTSAAPNFALDLCARKVTAQELAGLDLSCWTMALIGAEPLQRATLDRFAATLAPHGLHPHTLFQGYGLAEGVLASVCGSIDARFRSGSFDAAALRSGRVSPTAEGAATGRMLVSCGTPLRDQRVEIVDPVTHERCESDRVGEIWIAGPNVARGYWNRPDESAATFGAQLRGSDERFLRTGDLGFFADGELYVAGRIKDLIIIRGKNHHPQDIEQTVESCHPLLRPGCIAAFSVEDGGGERLVIAAELDVRALPQGDARAAAIAEVCERIRGEVSQQHELQVHAIALLEPGQLPKTSSGKIMRRSCRSEFLAGKLAEIQRSLLTDGATPRSNGMGQALAPELRSESSLATWIKARLVERLGVAPQIITAELPFAELGLDSREAVGLVGDLEIALDRKLQPTLLFDYPNISVLARFLAGAGTDVDAHSRAQVAAAAAPAPHAHQRRAAARLDPATARICIIGAGPAGLTAAYDLSQLGYRRITILEKRSEVGGKVMSAEHGGSAYELGQLFFTSAYKQTLELLRAFDIPLEQNAIATCHIDVHGQPLPPPNAAATHAWMMRLLATAGFRADELAVHAAHDRPELWEPMESWLKRHDLWPLPQNVLISWIAFGYGFPTDGLPIWYLLTYIMVLLSITTAERYSVPGGNQSLWRRIAAHLQSGGVELRTGARVRRIERTGSLVRIWLEGEAVREFDALIFACPPDAARSLLPESAPERELLAAFRHYDYVSALFLTEGLGSQRQFSFDRGFHPDGIGEVLCFEHRPESSIVTLGQYGSPYGEFAALSEAELTAFAQSSIERLGGRMVKPLALERWRFFFHLSPAEMQRGVLGALEARQGAEQTYFAGSYLTMETLEHTVAYTRELIAHFFAPAVQTGASEPARAAAEPIAIIGIGCRLPGGADDPAAFWQLLDRGEDAVSEVPPDRWSAERFYSADPAMPGRTISRWGGFLRNLDGVDHGFFGISAREARSLDPQGRLLLEVSWEALEDAGIVPAQLMGSDTGVFVGMSGVEYQLYALSDPQDIDGHSLLGSMHSTIAGRLSYWLGLKGPNLPVDTACSSSLVALHLACQALRLRECSIALTGGANITLSAEGTICFSKAGVLSPTGRCRTFSSEADGIVRAEGCGVLVLKRLSDAQRDGDRILSVIRGSAINQDGRSNGMTAPSGLAQQQVIRRALADAQLGPGDIDYIECHGTGTALGDPIEVQALGSVFKDRPRTQPLRLGSVKTNIGHAEAASGVAGVIKTVLALRHQRIPQSLHFTAPNPHIRWSELPVQVAAAAWDWPNPSRPRRAGVSAFGLSGTNAHVILEEAPLEHSSAVESPRSLPVLPFVISGKTRAALQAQAARLRAYLEVQPQLALADVAWSLATARTHFEERAVVLTGERSELLAALDAMASGQDAARLIVARPGARGRLAMLFSGQGSQRPGMGRELYEHFPLFRRALDQICEALDPHLPRPLLSILFAEAGSAEAALLDQTEFTQPALFALEVALFRLWEAWGVRPELVAGHSIGELAAAHAAGVFSLQEACRLVAARGRLMGALPGGAMVALAADEQEVRKLLEEHGGRVDIAAQNGPLATVIAGDEAAVLAIAEHFAARGRSTSRLAVSHAFHSSHMEPMLAAWRALVAQLHPQSPSTPLISLVTGKVAAEAELASPDHWSRQVRQPVRFLDGLYTLQANDAALYLELGPQAVLSALGAQSMAGEAQPGALFVPSLRRSQPEVETLLRALASLHVQGSALDWQRCLEGCGGRRISLPTYAFQRERQWIKPSLATQNPRPALASEPPPAAPIAAADSGPELDGVLLQTAWRQTVSVATSGFQRTGRWLLLADRQGLANRIETQLESMGSAVVRVEMLRPKQPQPRGWHTVDPQDPDAIAAMLDKVAAAKQPLRGVIYLWGLDAPQLDAQAEPLVHASWSGALNVAQSIAARQGATTPRLHIVTLRACTPEVHDAPRAEQALLFGLGTAISAQLPALRCQQIDVADPTSGQEAASLIKELFADVEESQIALRQDRRYVARLLRHAPLPVPDTALIAAGGRAFALASEQHGKAALLVARPAQRRAPGPGEIEVAVARAALHQTGLAVVSAVAGEVVAVGEGATALHIGQVVVGLVPGGAASHITAPAQLFVACPLELSLEQAAAGALAYPQVRHVLEQQAELGPGERLLILGAERPEGLAALHVGRLRGAEIFVARPADAAHSVLQELAPDHTVDITALPAGFTVDLILNAGTTATQKELLAALRRGGSLVDLDLGRLIARRPERVQVLLASTLAVLASGALPRFEPRVVPIQDIAFAAQQLASGAVVSLVGASPLLLTAAEEVRPALKSGGTWLVSGSSGLEADAAAQWLMQGDAERRTLPMAQALAASLPLRGVVHVEAPLPPAAGSRTAEIAQVLGSRLQAVWEVKRTAERLGSEELIIIASGAAWARPVAAFADASLDAFIEALCRGLRSQGRQALDMHCGRFSSDGGQLLGLPVDAAERRALLDSLLRARAAQPCILIQNAGNRFMQLGRSGQVSLPLYRDLLPARSGEGNGKLVGQLLGLSLPEATPHLSQLIRSRIAAMLSEDAETIDIQAPLNLLGLDSMSALELASRLQSDIGLRIPGTVLFEQGSIHSISEYLLSRLFSQHMHKEIA